MARFQTTVIGMDDENKVYEMVCKGDCFDFSSIPVFPENSFGLAFPLVNKESGEVVGERTQWFKEPKKVPEKVKPARQDFTIQPLAQFEAGSKAKIEAMAKYFEENGNVEDDKEFSFFTLTDEEVSDRLATTLLGMERKLKNKILEQQG